MCVLVSFEAIVDSVVKINSLNFGFLIIQSCFWFFLFHRIWYKSNMELIASFYLYMSLFKKNIA